MRIALPLRPPRWSINLLCGLSLLIFLLAMGIWVRSYFAYDSVHWFRNPGAVHQTPENAWAVGYWIAWSRGAVSISRTSYAYTTAMPDFYYDVGFGGMPTTLIETSDPGDKVNIALAGFQFRSARNKTWPAWDRSVVLPLWLFGLFAIPPVLWVRRYRRKRGRGFPVEVVEATA